MVLADLANRLAHAVLLVPRRDVASTGVVVGRRHGGDGSNHRDTRHPWLAGRAHPAYSSRLGDELGCAAKRVDGMHAGWRGHGLLLLVFVILAAPVVA